MVEFHPSHRFTRGRWRLRLGTIGAGVLRPCAHPLRDPGVPLGDPGLPGRIRLRRLAARAAGIEGMRLWAHVVRLEVDSREFRIHASFSRAGTDGDWERLMEWIGQLAVESPDVLSVPQWRPGQP